MKQNNFGTFRAASNNEVLVVLQFSNVHNGVDVCELIIFGASTKRNLLIP